MQSALVKFSVKNHGSIKEQQTFSFASDGNADQADASLLEFPSRSLKIGKAAAIYGANASGKTTFLDAFLWLRAAVLYSQRHWAPDRAVPVSPFALGEVGPDESSEFAVTIFLGESRYDYELAINAERVLAEKLFVWPANRKQSWFERSGNSFKFGKSLHGDNEAIGKLVRRNSLFLSAAAQNNHAQLMPLYSWFENVSQRMRTHTSRISPDDILTTEEGGAKLLGYQKDLVRFLRAADTGILDLKIDEVPRASSERAPIPTAPQFRRFRLEMKHSGAVPGWLPFSAESTGTQAMFDVALMVSPVLERGGTILIDELERSLHPAIAIELVRWFQDPERNPRGAQLLFTTHDVTLLGNASVVSPLRRDQIWFTEKDKSGATNLYPLTDFHPRKGENLEKGYLQGRYGAVPFLGDFRLVAK